MNKRRGMLAPALAMALVACSPQPESVRSNDSFGLPPRHAAATADHAQIELGRKLFFDRRLSFNGTMSCAMCHVPEQGYTSNASKTALGIEGKSLRRNAPTLLNVAWQELLFHDGREFALETQAWMPLLHADEMANPSIGQVLQRIASLPDYAGQFERAYAGAGPGMQTVGEALAAFETSLVAADSRFDRWRYGGQAQASSAPEQAGFRVFAGKGRCISCHSVDESNALFADGKFHVTGAGETTVGDEAIVVPLAQGVQTVLHGADLAAFDEKRTPDLGRFEITLNPADKFAFKTPSLRNVAHTAPYMHDGSLATLEAVIEFYDRGGGAVSGKSTLLAPLGLSAEEKRDLAVFLRSLDGAKLGMLMGGSRPAAAP